jgi:hypothetical protein
MNARKGGFRVRYTGKPLHLPVAFNVRTNAIELTFSAALDPKEAVDPQSYDTQQANYRWHAPTDRQCTRCPTRSSRAWIR